MELKVIMWDMKWKKFIRETLTEEDLSEITKQKIMSYSSTEKEELNSFEIESIDL
jgi:hypothetical protein